MYGRGGDAREAQAAARRAADVLRGMWHQAHSKPFLAFVNAVLGWRLAEALWKWRRRTLRRSGVVWDSEGPRVRERVASESVMALMALEGKACVAIAIPWRHAAGSSDGGLRGLLELEASAGRTLLACNGTRNLRMAVKEDIVKGRAANRWGMWRVREVMDVRIPEGRRGRQLEVCVRWEGEWVGEERESWVPIARLNATCKAEAREMEREKRGRCERPEDTEGEIDRRVSPRLAGAVPIVGL